MIPVYVYDELTSTVNEILGDHNVDKQISDSKGDVSVHSSSFVNPILTVDRLRI